jgi:hypothetical protein
MGNMIMNEGQVRRKKASRACFKAYEINKSVQQSHLTAGIQTGALALRQAAVHDTLVKRVT